MKGWFAQWWKDIHTELDYRMPNHVHRRILQAKDIADCLVLAVAFGALFGVLVCVAGCHTYTVVAADYHAVPIKQTGPETYERAVEDATGWYVPDALMLELLDAK